MELVVADFADGEVAGFGVGEVEAADRGGGGHGAGFGERDADAFGHFQQVKEGALGGVVGTGGVAGGGTDASVLLGDEAVVVQCFVGGVAPVFAAHALVQPFGGGFGEAVCQGFEHDGVVVVVRFFQTGEFALDADAGGDGEGAEPVGYVAAHGGDKIGQRVVGFACRTAVLLAQAVPGHADFLALFVAVEVNVVARAVGGENAPDGAGGEQALCHDAVQHGLRVLKYAARGLAHFGRLQDGGVASVQIPGLEKGRPVDEGQQFGKVNVAVPDAGLLRHGGRVAVLRGGGVGGAVAGGGGLPAGAEGVFARLRQRYDGKIGLAFVVVANVLIFLRNLGAVAFALFFGEQRGDDADGARGVRHVDDAVLVIGGNLDGGVVARGGRAADEQRHGEALTLHFGSNVAHFFQRRGNQSGKTNGLRAVFARGVQDFFAGHHDTEVNDFIAVAAQYDADDVFADVVHVALDRGNQDAPFAGGAGALFFRLNPRNQVGDGLLHDARRFDHLRQKHFARAEEFAHGVHAVHQRPFDDRQRRFASGGQFGAHGFGVFDDKFGDAFDQRVRQPLAHRPLPPGQIGAGFARLTFDGLGDFDEGVARAGVTVQHNVFDLFAQRRIQFVIDAQLPGIDDAHGETGAHGVVEEHGVDGFAHRLVAAKAERDVGDTARGARVRQVLVNPAHGFDEVDGVVVVRFNAGGDGENVGVENDVFGREISAAFRFRAGEQVVGALADFGFARKGVGLTDFVKGHDDDCRPIAARQARVLQEFFFAFFQRDGIDHAFTLNAAQARFDHVPARRVNHDGHAGNVRLGGDELQKARHRGDRIQHRFVHVDVDNLRAVFYLLTGNRQRVIKAAFQNHAREGTRAGHIRALAHVHKQAVRVDGEGFQPRQTGAVRGRGQRARRVLGNGLRHGSNVRGRGAAAAADDVEQTGARPFVNGGGELFGCFVIAGGRQRVGQTGVGVGADKTGAVLRQRLYVRAQFGSA